MRKPTKLTHAAANRLKKLKMIRARFSLFCANCLKIVTKDRKRIPFKWNRAQRYVHKKIEEQRKETGGVVRALMLKGRQQGLSTYVAARFYHRAAMFKFINVYILSHQQKSADTLFKIVDRYHDSNPFAPSVGRNNQSEMEFDKLESSYAVATAGEGEGGRSMTATLFHGSEIAFWKHANKHFAASVQTIPYEDGTEIILESTANGPSGKFYELWQDAIAGKGDYIAIFVPWFWQEEYVRPVGPGFELQDDGDDDNLSEIDYFDTFEEVTLENMAWRRAKIIEVGRELFDQEYPATAAMAFSKVSSANYISALPVLKARKREVQGAGPLIIGVDPAGEGGDRFAIAGRRGHACEFVKWRDKLNQTQAYHWIKEVIAEDKPARMNIDAGGIGAPLLALLRNDEDIPKGLVHGVNFGSPSQFKQAQKNNKLKAADIRPGPVNRRAEMYQRMKQWLELEEGVSIPDLEVLQSDLTVTQIKPNLTNDLQLESKHEMRKRNIRSPDLADSLALTFASLARITSYEEKQKPVDPMNPDAVAKYRGYSGSSQHGWMS